MNYISVFQPFWSVQSKESKNHWQNSSKPGCNLPTNGRIQQIFDQPSRIITGLICVKWKKLWIQSLKQHSAKWVIFPLVALLACIFTVLQEEMAKIITVIFILMLEKHDEWWMILNIITVYTKGDETVTGEHCSFSFVLGYIILACSFLLPS